MEMLTKSRNVSLYPNKTLDKDGLKTLHDNFFQKLFFHALKFMKVPEEAEEVVNDAFIKVWERRKEFYQIDDIEAYLTITVKNLCLNRIKSWSSKFSKELQELPADHLISHTILPDEALCRDELHEMLQNAVASLPPQCRKVFQLIKEDGMKYKEAAKVLGLTTNTVDAHLAKAIKILRKSLQNHTPKQRGKVVKMETVQISLVFLIFFLI